MDSNETFEPAPETLRKTSDPLAEWAGAVATAETRHGTLLYPVADDPIGRAIREYGEWSMFEFDVLEALVRTGSTVLDVGANLGTHTLGLAHAVGPLGHLHAFEPQRFIFALLAENIRHNALAQAQAHLCCVGARAGTAQIPQLNPRAPANFGGVGQVFGADGVPGYACVPVVTLDGLGLTNVSLIKIDVEGAEAQVLAGAAELIARDAPAVYFETNSLDAAVDSLRFFKERPYALYLHRAPAFNPRNFRGASHNFFGVATETNVLALPSAQLESYAALLRNEQLFPFRTIDEFAALLLASPRYGDEESFGRSAEILRQGLADANEQIAQLQLREEVVQQQFRRARDRVADLEKQIRSRRRQQNALNAQIESLGRTEAEQQQKLARFDSMLRAREERIHLLTGQLRSHRVDRAARALTALRELGGDLRVGFADGPGAAVKRFKKLAARKKRHAEERAIIEASGSFDTLHYLRYSDSLDPIQHYLQEGAAKGYNPNATFDTALYLKSHPELRGSPQNPFVHHLLAIRAKRHADDAPGSSTPSPLASGAVKVATQASLPAAPALEAPGLRAAVTLPTPDEWSACKPHSPDNAVVDIVIPVYRGYADTLRAVHRVLASTNNTPFELIVIDDASPQPELSAELRELARGGLFTYLHNQENLGFVATVNRGMALHESRDVLLLNSDTEVFHDWVDRIRAAAYQADDIGTVTPFSNSATICSYPFATRDHEHALEVSYAELDRIAAAENAGIAVEIPTAVGFAMYIRRDCLHATGLFDVEKFGKGYGEENDFCCRALDKQFRSVMACDVFVRHTGGASFLGEKAGRIANAMKKLDELHPDYRPAVRAHIAAQPVMPYRQRIDLARVRRVAGGPVLVLVTHSRGGGTEQHVQQIVELARAASVKVMVLRPGVEKHSTFLVSFDDAEVLAHLPGLSLADPIASARFLLSLGAQHMHVHHLIDFPEGTLAWVEEIARSKILTVDFTVHDYSPVCPQINLIDQSKRYCGEPVNEAVCNRCITESGSRFGTVAIGPFRRRHERMLARMQRVFVPNADVQDRLRRYFPAVETLVLPHPEPAIAPRRPPPLRPGQKLKVAVLGAIGVHKGYEVLLACAKDAKTRNLPLEFCVVGYTCGDPQAIHEGIEITGAYKTTEEALELLASVGAHVSFFPAVWPETYSFTLTVSNASGLHPVAFDFGAIAERLRAFGAGTLLPVETITDPSAINDALLSLMDDALRTSAPTEARSYSLDTYYPGVFRKRTADISTSGAALSVG